MRADPHPTGNLNLVEHYTDLQNLDDSNRLRLTCEETAQDLERSGLPLGAGLLLTFYTVNKNEAECPDELRAEGGVYYDDQQCWVAVIDWGARGTPRKSPPEPYRSDSA